MAQIKPTSRLKGLNTSKIPWSRLGGLFPVILLAVGLFLVTSLHVGGHMMGPTHVSPGNVGVVINNFSGRVERDLMPAGTHWQGLWETVIEVPTAQRTIDFSSSGGNDPHGDPHHAQQGPIQVNTISNMLQVDVSAQYRISADHAQNLYDAYQDQFADQERFEDTNLAPAVKGAINYAVGDMDTATALTTVGKQQAEREALKALNDEWGPRGVIFSNLMIRGIEQDQASKDLLASTLTKLQDIENAKLALQQQVFENTTLIQAAKADAQVNQLQNSTLTDLYVQDQLLGQVKKLYLPTDEITGALGK